MNAIAKTKEVPVYNVEIKNCAATTPELFVDTIGIRQSTDVAYLSLDVILFDKNGRKGNLQWVPNAKVTNISSQLITWTQGNATLTTNITWGKNNHWTNVSRWTT